MNIITSRLAALLPTGQRLGRTLSALFAASVFAATAAHAQNYLFQIHVGNGVALDHTDGTGNNARFFNPTGVAVDAAGTIYIADGGDHTIRKVTTGGIVTTLAGASGQAGSADGTGSGARFTYPFAIAVDATGTLYVSDVGDHTIRKVTAGGTVTTIAGSAGVAGSTDGTGTAALFNYPQGVAVDATGNVYVSDTNNSTIRKISTTGVVTTFAGAVAQNGTADGAGGSARFNYPAGITADVAGNIYVADNGNSSIRRITSGGSVSTFAGQSGTSGSADGVGTAARFDHPVALSLDAAGNLYVIDTSNQTVRKISTSTGAVSTLAGSAGLGGNAEGVGAAARFFYPFGIGVSAAGAIYVADTGNHSVRAVTATGAVTTLAGKVGLAGIADGLGGEALFAYPAGLAVDSAGTVYVADHNNHTVRKITAIGGVTTLAGAAGVYGSADGQGSAARFYGLSGVAVDNSGNVYVADTTNNTIRKITAGGSVSTFAGSGGSAGSADGVGSAARFNAPQGIAVDSVGNVYVADTNNSTIRKITAGGSVSTLAGVAGQTGNADGAGAGARFNGPYAVAVDGSGNVYVSDFFNSTIRKITSAGTVSTLAGLAGKAGATDGIGAAARFNQAYGLTVDGSGNVFVADTYNRAIRKVTADGTVSTLNGALSRFYYPQGIAVDTSGNLYIADGDNQAIIKAAIITPPAGGMAINSQTVFTGGTATFSVGSPVALTSYQWQVSTDSGVTWTSVTNTAPYSGATGTTLTVSGTTESMSGYRYRVQLSNSAGSNTSGVATLTVSAGITPSTGDAHLTNLAVRTTLAANQVLTVGLTMAGGSRDVLLRAAGPALTALGVSGAMADPKLALFNGSAQIAANDNWGTPSANASAVASANAATGAFSLGATTSLDAALVTSVENGRTVQVSGPAAGNVIVEAYDTSSTSTNPRLTNLSALNQVGTGGDILIAGFSISGTGSVTLLIRGIGPTLTQFGVSGALVNPRLAIYNSAGAQINANAGWGGGGTLSAAFAQVGAFALPATSTDTALLVSLPAGGYTVQLSGANNTTGNGLIEVYEVR